MTNDRFEDILQRLTEKLNTIGLGGLSGMNDRDFEKEVFSQLKGILSAEGLSLDGLKYKEDSTVFPDIGYENFGLEVKTTKADSWTCLGNSIMEGTRREEVDQIYLIFLKRGGTPEVRFKRYDDCISDIKITHSPRYEINMDVEADETVFSIMGTDYNHFRDDPEKIKNLRDFYKRKGVKSWWLDEGSGESVTEMELYAFGGLPQERKHEIMIELFCYFPEILGSDYDAAATYLVSKGIYNKSFRDEVSASGQIDLRIDDTPHRASRVFKFIFENLGEIKDYLEENTEKILAYWGGSADMGIFRLWVRKCNENILKNGRLTYPEDYGLPELISLFEKGRLEIG